MKGNKRKLSDAEVFDACLKGRTITKLYETEVSNFFWHGKIKKVTFGPDNGSGVPVFDIRTSNRDVDVLLTKDEIVRLLKLQTITQETIDLPGLFLYWLVEREPVLPNGFEDDILGKTQTNNFLNDNDMRIELTAEEFMQIFPRQVTEINWKQVNPVTPDITDPIKPYITDPVNPANPLGWHTTDQTNKIDDDSNVNVSHKESFIEKLYGDNQE